MAIASASSLRLAIFPSAVEGNAVMANLPRSGPVPPGGSWGLTAGLLQLLAAADVLESRIDENDPMQKSRPAVRGEAEA